MRVCRNGPGASRCNQRVAISAEGIPIRDLLALLSEKTRVDLKAQDYVANDKIVLFTPARPLRDVLNDIATLFDDGWLPGKTGDHKNRYLLVRTQRGRDYEDGLSQDMNRKMLAQMDAQVKALQETPDELKRRPASDPIRRALSTEDGRLGTGIFALLNAQQRAQLMENWRTQIPVSMLSAEQKKGLEPLFFGDRFDASKTGGFVLNQIPREEMDKHEMRFNLIGFHGELSVYMTAPIGFNVEVTKFSAGAKFLLPPHGNPYTGKPVKAGAGLPDSKRVAVSRGASWVETLHALEEKTGMPVVADFYRSKPVHAADGEQDVSSDPAVQALDALSRPEGYLWWTRDKTLLLRKRDWYSQRLYEAPDWWVETVAKRIDAHKDALTYADVLSLSDLSVDQIIGLFESLGLHTNRDNLSGLREMLASLAACPIDVNTRLYKGIVIAGDSQKLGVHPYLNDARQRALLADFARAFPRDLIGDIRKAGGDPQEFGYLVIPHGGRAVGDTPGASVEVDALFTIHQGISAGFILALPTSLPDDRRANTRIVVTP
ncbi:MAG TPA: hypothetical protein VKT77_03170 [Chthonomonadaceae bacterium]|nr:hypothetical protein [Chthonomonadaceae bacterium]